MSRRQREDGGRPWPLRLTVVVTVLLGVVATGVAVAAYMAATRAPAPVGCAPVAWMAVPDGATLPAGWRMVSSQLFVDNLATTIAGPASSTGQRPAVFASVTCYGADAGLALRRAHEGALAAGGADVAFAGLGDESLAVFSSAASSTTLYIRRGTLLAVLTAPTAVDRTTLDTIGRSIDTAMVRALQVAVDASPIAQPSLPDLASAPPAASSPTPAPSGPAPSASAAAESHAAPDLEAKLPHVVGTTTLSTQSVLGTTALGSGQASQSLIASLKQLGKASADLQIAGAYDPTGASDLHLFAYRVAGVDATELGRAVIESQLTNTAAQATSSQVTIGGHALTKISYAQGSPVYVYVLNGIVYAIESADAGVVATVVGLLT